MESIETMEATLADSRRHALPRPRRFKPLAWYGGVALLATAIIYKLHALNRVRLTIPFNPYGDAGMVQALVKGMMEHGSYLHNPSLAAPFGQNLYDFPNSDFLHIALLRLISFFAPNAAWAINVYYLACFPLTAVIALAVLLSFEISGTSAALVSLLYAFLPYHFLRGEGHLFLSGYYLVPISCWFAVRLFENDPRREPKIWPSIWACLLIASSGVYYAFFHCFFIAVAGLLASIERRGLGPIRRAVTLAAATFAGLLANIAPSLLYWAHHGRNHAVANRSFADAEIHGLKIAQLLLPVLPHPIHWLSHIHDKYVAYAPLVAENDWVELGTIGSIGFLFLIAVIFLKRDENPRGRRFGALSRLNLAGLLLAQIGGFGVLFNLFINPTIRAYNRISVFIAFFSYMAFAMLLDQARAKLVRTSVGRAAFHGGAALLLLLALADQTGPAVPGDNNQAFYVQDEQFFSKVESALPAHSALFELPYVGFPESPPAYHEDVYDQIQPYLHTKTLSWSYAAITGREAASWLQATSKLPPGRMISELRSRGFAGVLINKKGYPDQGAALEKQIAHLTGATPVTGGFDNRFAFFALGSRPK